jgi:Uma2 family endonuclease
VDILSTPPLLVVEVVSPGDKNTERDYVTKEAEYSEFGIREYWTADRGSQTPNVTVRVLVGDSYEALVFTGNQRIISRVFPELVLTAQQVLSV